MTGPSLKRTTFKTSRLAEFCSEKELVNQTGHDVELPRGQLASLLYDATRDTVEYLFDNSISSLEQTEDGVRVTFRSGAQRTFGLVVAADGLNSVVRRAFESKFGASVSHTTNKFAWYGTTKTFATLSQTFLATDPGTFNAHHYRYSPTMSTFLVECDAATWQAYGFEHKTVEQSQAICEEIFADTLDGHSLISNKRSDRFRLKPTRC